MFKSKRISMLTILALLIPTSAGLAGFGSSAATAATDLSVLTVNGQDVSGLTTYELDPYTTSVTVVATPSDATATAVVTLNGTTDGTAVVEGNNTLSVTVTDGQPSSTTTALTLVVPKGDNTDAIIVVNDEELVNGEGTEVDWGITSVPVVVTLADAAASVKVNGISLTKNGAVASGTVTGLETGENLIDIVVTAADGLTVDESQIGLTVLKNTDTSATLTVDGLQVDDGDTVLLDALTTDVDLQVLTADEGATFEIVGADNLIVGENRVEIYVTAEDGVTVGRYDLTLVVAENDDASIDDLKVNGVSISDGDTVELPYQTTAVNVAVFLSDLDASYLVEGGTELMQGDNDLIITVTAPDNKTVIQYTAVLHVNDPDVTLKTFKFNGVTITADSTVETYSLSNTLELAPTDSRATFTLDGGTYDAATGALSLEAGSNEITVTVLGDDKATTADYVFTILKAGIEVDFEGSENPVAVVNGSSVTVPANTKEVTLEVTAPVAGSTVEVEGNKDLEVGVNQVYVIITSPDLRVVTTVFSVTVLPASTALSTFTVNEDDVVLDGITGSMTLEAGTTSVEVVVETVDEDATYVITGDNHLVLGSNLLRVFLTTSDGQTVVYTVTLIVPASTNADFDAISINGVEFKDEDLVEVNSGVVDVQVDTQENHATVAITGVATANTIGGNVSITNGVITASGYVTLTVVVTAQDGVTKSEPVVINVLASTDLGVTNGSNPSDDEIRVGTYAKADASLAQANFAAGSKLSYKWTVDGVAVPNATTTRLLLVADHLEAEVRPVVVSGTGSTLKTIVGKTFVVALGIIKKAPTPSVLGKSAIGLNLKAVSKVWSEDVELSYKWYINYEDAESEAVATTEEFLIKADDVSVGDTITLGVTGSLDGYASVEKLSAPMTVTIGSIKITTKPTISADPGYVTGGTITAAPGASNVADAEATFEWTRNGAVIADATDAEYTLTGADFNKKLAVKVTYALDGYTSASMTIKTPTIKVGTLEDVDAPTIEAAGGVLTAMAGFSTDVAATSVQYIWYRNGRAVTDAKSATYTLKLKDKGTKISVRVIGNYLGYKSTSVLSEEDSAYLVPKN